MLNTCEQCGGSFEGTHMCGGATENARRQKQINALCGEAFNDKKLTLKELRKRLAEIQDQIAKINVYWVALDPYGTFYKTQHEPTKKAWVTRGYNVKEVVFDE